MIRVGDTAPTRHFGPLTRTDIVRYAGASGDFNPMHHDEPLARSLGLPSVFAMGMLPAGLLATTVTDWLGRENVRRFAVRFSSKVWPGDELTCEAKVIEATPVEDRLEVVLDLACTKQTGGVAVAGWATFHLENRG